MRKDLSFVLREAASAPEGFSIAVQQWFVSVDAGEQHSSSRTGGR